MTAPGPADEIRAAAEKLRALATAASTPLARGGKPTRRWHFAERTRGSGYLYAENPDGPGTRLTSPGMHPRHGQYAAAMDPGVGAALADWLEHAAKFAELHALLTHASGQEVAEPDLDAGVRHALAVARAFLKEQP